MRSMTKILCSTGAFSRDPDVTFPDHIVDMAHRVTCDGFELILYPAWYDRLDEVADLFRRSGVRWMTLHAEKSIGPLLGSGDRDNAARALRRLEANCSFASQLDIPFLVLHLWGMPDSDRNIDTNLSYLDECLMLAEAHGIELSIETIPCLESSPLAHIRRIISTFPDISITLDSEFLAMHRELDAALQHVDVRSAMRHVHIKGFDGMMANPDGSRRYLHPGQGTIDLSSFISKVAELSQRPSLCLEATSVRRDGNVDVDQVIADLAFIRHATGTEPKIA